MDLSNFRSIFHQWSYDKDEDKQRFKYELSNLIYNNGQFYWKEMGDAKYVNGSLITSMIESYEEGEIYYTTKLIVYAKGSLEFN